MYKIKVIILCKLSELLKYQEHLNIQFGWTTNFSSFNSWRFIHKKIAVKKLIVLLTFQFLKVIKFKSILKVQIPDLALNLLSIIILFFSFRRHVYIKIPMLTQYKYVSGSKNMSPTDTNTSLSHKWHNPATYLGQNVAKSAPPRSSPCQSCTSFLKPHMFQSSFTGPKALLPQWTPRKCEDFDQQPSGEQVWFPICRSYRQH